MRKTSEKLNEYRVRMGFLATTDEDGLTGAFMVPMASGKDAAVVSGNGMGWEHVSVSLPNRCPSWSEMCLIKDLFWDEEEAVLQIHPRKSEYVNNHPYCLHLWKPVKDIELPPSILVGLKAGEELVLAVDNGGRE